MRLVLTVIASALILLAGCVSTNATLLGSAQARPAIDATQVRLYRTADQVPGKYEEVALLNSTGASGFTDEPKMFDSMKKKAASLGANAVILDAITEPSAGAKVAAAFLGTPAERKGKAIAIYVYPSDGDKK